MVGLGDPVSIMADMSALVFDKSRVVTCMSCDDIDFCLKCFKAAKDGHHPGHRFKAAGQETTLTSWVEKLCAPGRNVAHFAICDGCDKVYWALRY